MDKTSAAVKLMDAQIICRMYSLDVCSPEEVMPDE
jgi:hypothetical protein